MKTELLSPAGSKEAAMAAIHNGADAIYLGGYAFGARASAENFSNENIVEIIKYAHLLDVKVYATVNTLIKDSEMEEALELIAFLYNNYIDAIIIQDIGLAKLIKQKYPFLALHASTQMNIHSLNQAKFLASLGFKRVVLARECSYEIIKEIKNKVDIEVEVFVHGALCMSYSGNCYMSSFIGKRSGNRGRCAQPCRLPYTLNEDSKPEYWLSPKDLLTLPYLKQLIEIGIESFKIEGRMKKPEYVASVTSAYKNMLDSLDTNKYFNINQSIDEMSLMFNRQFTKGFMFNENNSMFTNTKTSNHIGQTIGKVIRVNGRKCYIQLISELHVNDSIRITSKEEDGITISEMWDGNENINIAHPEMTIQIMTHKKADVGADVLLTSSDKLIKKLKNYSKKIIDIEGSLFIENGHLALMIKCQDAQIIEYSNNIVQEAQNESMAKRLLEQIQKTNQTVYRFVNIENNTNDIFLPIGEINDLRRRALDSLTIERMKKYETERIFGEIYYPVGKEYDKNFNIIVQINTKEQLMAALESDIEVVFVEDEQLLKYAQNSKKTIIFVKPRIESEKDIKGVVQNYQYVGRNQLITSHYLNVFNAHSVAFWHEQGSELVGLSIEMSKHEVKEMFVSYKKHYKSIPNVYMMLYGYYELMIMKHCLINKACEYSKKNCRECLKKQYFLKDRFGYKFTLQRDDSCNLRLLNSQRLHLYHSLNEIKALGINKGLLVFTIENYQETKSIIELYMKNKLENDECNSFSNITYGHFFDKVK